MTVAFSCNRAAFTLEWCSGESLSLFTPVLGVLQLVSELHLGQYQGHGWPAEQGSCRTQCLCDPLHSCWEVLCLVHSSTCDAFDFSGCTSFASFAAS